jgi:hypothetical protein
MNKLGMLSDDLNQHKAQGLAIKLFQHNEAEAAMDFADNGGQALHLWKPFARDWPEAPFCFKRSASEWGHLCDMDVDRLVSTARSLGVVVIVVSRRGMRGQHIDLCGGPLRKAKELCQ